MAHDLRAPLVNLEGFTNELGMAGDELRLLMDDDRVPADVRDRVLAVVNGDMAESIRFLKTGVRRLSGIVEALLRLAQVGRIEYQRQLVDVNAVVTSVIGSLSATMAARGATVNVAKLPPCWGDPLAVERIFANLIGNALNYLNPLRPGLIEVGCEPAARPEASGSVAALQTYFVRDNGLGIPESCRPLVFRTIKRMHPDNAPGEGIGLMIVHRIVERLGGRIWFDSIAGEGSTFFVALPCDSRQTATSWSGGLIEA